MSFQYEPYDNSRSANSIAELMWRAAQIRANQQRQIAEIQAQQQAQAGSANAHLVSGIGQQVAGSIGDMLRYRQEAPQRAAQQQRTKQDAELRGLQIQNEQQNLTAGAEESAARKASADYAARMKAKADAYIANTENPTRKGLESAIGPTEGAAYWKQYYEKPEPPKLNEHDPTKEQRDAFGNLVTPAVAPPPAKVTFGRPADMLLDGKVVPIFPGSDGGLYFNGQKVEASRVASKPDKVTGDSEPLVPVMGPDGKPVLVRRSQAEGKTPANAREQGRPVTSGDAGRIADLDTSLNDLVTLTQTLSGVKDATGTSAQIGAALPNFVTNATGWGTDAKTKQAVIDRVKQVIGKALEGGVLRKEDETKYGKILPTIGDSPEVVTSKLTGLQRAIQQRRETTLSALEDANYDVSKFKARTSGPQKIGRFTVEVEP